MFIIIINAWYWEAFIQHAVEESATTGTALQGLLYIIDFREVYYLWLTREAELVVVKCMLSFLFLVRSPTTVTPYINNGGMWAQLHGS